MGYYLDMTYPETGPELGYAGTCLGGKFFGYLEDEEFANCISYCYLSGIKDDADMLNVFWSCYHFTLTKPQAVKFLSLYAYDLKRLKSEESADTVEFICDWLDRQDIDHVDFEMG